MLAYEHTFSVEHTDSACGGCCGEEGGQRHQEPRTDEGPHRERKGRAACPRCVVPEGYAKATQGLFGWEGGKIRSELYTLVHLSE